MKERFEPDLVMSCYWILFSFIDKVGLRRLQKRYKAIYLQLLQIQLFFSFKYVCYSLCRVGQSCAGDCRRQKPQAGLHDLLQIFFPIPRQFYSGFQEERSLRRSPQEYLLQKWWRKLVPSQGSRWAEGNTKKRFQLFWCKKCIIFRP